MYTCLRLCVCVQWECMAYRKTIPDSMSNQIPQIRKKAKNWCFNALLHISFHHFSVCCYDTLLRAYILIYSAFRKYSYPLTYSTFCFINLNSKWIKCFFLTHLHTIAHNDKVKTCFCTFEQIYKEWNTLSQYILESPLAASTAVSLSGLV